VSEQETSINQDNEKESASQIEVEKKIMEIEAGSQSIIKKLEHTNKAKLGRLREEYNQEIQSLVQMLEQEKQKSLAKVESHKDKSQQVDLQDETQIDSKNDKENVESTENENISVCLLNEFDIDEWRRKEVGWEENKKTLENTIHQLKQEIKEQNEFLELKNKGK
jgi:hypothetical protein